MSDFGLYILKKYLLIPLLVLCIPILWGLALQCIVTPTVEDRLKALVYRKGLPLLLAGCHQHCCCLQRHLCHCQKHLLELGQQVSFSLP